MDPPLSDDDSSVYSSSLRESQTRSPKPEGGDNGTRDNEDANNTLSNSSSAASVSGPKASTGAETAVSVAVPAPVSRETTPSSLALAQQRGVFSRSASVEKEKINDEDIKVKIPLTTSIMLTKLDPNTNDIIESLSVPKTEKLTVKFVPIGSIEQIQPKVFKISSSQQFQTLVKFLNKKLDKNIEKKQVNKLFGGSIFCYLNNSFCPGPEEIIGNLFEHFAINNELTVSYCDTMAFR